MIQPEWHGWMHHMFDETPDEPVPEIETVSTVPSVSHAIYGSHLGLAAPSDTPLVDVSQYR